MPLKTAAVLLATLAVTVSPAIARSAGPQNAVKTNVKTLTVRGVVKSVTDSSLIIEASGRKVLTFAVDSATRVLKPGATAKAGDRTTSAATGLVIGDIVRLGDRVTVRYQQLDSSLKATEVRVGSR